MVPPPSASSVPVSKSGEFGWHSFDPLLDDAQAMALVKTFKLCIDPMSEDGTDCWVVWHPSKDARNLGGADLNRAIVECVALMQMAVAESRTKP
jgi:hypothetical protein